MRYFLSVCLTALFYPLTPSSQYSTASASPTSTTAQTDFLSTNITTTPCPTTCPTSTTTVHPGFIVSSSTTAPCPIAKCLSESPVTITSILPCSTDPVLIGTGPCTVPPSCLTALPLPTVTVTDDSVCPELCPRSTQVVFLGGGCPRTA
ncbi:hypothetical protein HOY82DRAFT_568138 [Tuber indicum]|nr:hypothetical protein HOY82DRAFT_568138 [Tuber indicum]